jgi:hypothetical protein
MLGWHFLAALIVFWLWPFSWAGPAPSSHLQKFLGLVIIKGFNPGGEK